MAWQLLRGFHAVSLFGTMGLEGLQTEPSGSARKALVGSRTARAFFVPRRMFFNNGDCVCRGGASRWAEQPQHSAARACAPVRTRSLLAWLRLRSRRSVRRRLQVQALPCQPDFVLSASAGRTSPFGLRPKGETAAWRRITVGNGGKGALPMASRRTFGSGSSRQARPSRPRRATGGDSGTSDARK